MRTLHRKLIAFGPNLPRLTRHMKLERVSSPNVLTKLKSFGAHFPPKPPNSNVLRVSVRGWPRRRATSHVPSRRWRRISDGSGVTRRRSDATSKRFVPKRIARKRSGRTSASNLSARKSRRLHRSACYTKSSMGSGRKSANGLRTSAKQVELMRRNSFTSGNSITRNARA